MGYFGSKATSGLCQPLIAMMPPHDTYIETHLGGGAIMRRKPAALHNIGIDRDARALGEFECDYRVELIHGCAHRFLSEYAFEGSELLYSDPPYLRHTRTSKHRYRFDYEEADHVELLELLKGVPCQVMVSGYGSALYEERLEGWRRVELQVMNHAGVRTECVWMNFPADRLLRDFNGGVTPFIKFIDPGSHCGRPPRGPLVRCPRSLAPFDEAGSAYGLQAPTKTFMRGLRLLRSKNFLA